MTKICKIVTCGDVDSGKSTLLGRLLYNTNNIYDDQLADIEKYSKKYSLDNRFEYGLLFDGLLEERKQQITIDVAHRFFNLKDKRFHLFDCPGHAQYTHNFVIAAAEADIAILVIDSTKGLMPQTLVHLEICKLFKIKKIILAITKIDLVNETILNLLENSINNNLCDVEYTIFKTSAIENINIDCFAEFLYNESLKINQNLNKFALCVQSVKKLGEKRLYQGISFGNLQNNSITIYPTKINCNIYQEKGTVDIFSLDKKVDISRGYVFANFELKNSSKINGRFIKFNNKISNSNLLFKYGTLLTKVKHLKEESLELYEPIDFCNINEFKNLGYGLLIDEVTKLNVGIFIIQDNNETKSKNYCYWLTYHLIFLVRKNNIVTKRGKFVFSKISGYNTALINRFLLVPLIIAFKYNTPNEETSLAQLFFSIHCYIS